MAVVARVGKQPGLVQRSPALKPTYFISDLHLSESDKETTARFQSFLARRAQGGQSLYILGDLFDAWVGDDQLRRDPFAQAVADQIAAMASLNCQVFLLRGNRDFALGYRFARAARAVMLPEQHTLTAGRARILLLHGDELCIHDRGYQRYRRFIRNPLVLGTLLALPYFVRRRIADGLRRDAAHAPLPPSCASLDPYDADPSAATGLAQSHQAQIVIHGHTHRPFDHPPVGDRPRRLVLSDWQFGRGVLRMDVIEGEPQFTQIPWGQL